MGRSVLILVCGFVVISGIIQMNNANRANMLPERVVDQYHEYQARNVASSLIDGAINKLLTDMDWNGTITTDKYYRGSGTLTTGNDPADPSNEFKVLLTSTGNFEGYTAKTEVLMIRDSFSKYSYFTDEEKLPNGTNIWWWNGDEVNGPIHTNGTFRMAGSPTFNGFITSPNDWIGYSGNEDSNDPDERHGSETPQFNNGSNFNLNRIRKLPGAEQITELVDLSNSGGVRFEEDATLEFYVDGGEGYVKRIESDTVSCGTDCTTTNLIETDYRLSDYNGVISVNGKTEVKGTVKGQITLHSSQEIEIMGDILYDGNPLDGVSSSTDMIGMVSEGDVIVDRYAHEDNGSYDLTIQASIMALGTSFEVEEYSSGDPRGTLTLVGGIVQKNRGPVGTFSGGSVSSGYTKNYLYDERLRHTVPPSYPRESVFTIVYWKDHPIQN